MKYLSVILLYIFTLAAVAAEIPADHPSIKDALDANGVVSADGLAPLPNIGVVASTIHSNNYTYIEIKNDKNNIWLAAPKVELIKDTRVRYGRGIAMINFYSNGLKRVFPEIYFVERVEIVEYPE